MQNRLESLLKSGDPFAPLLSAYLVFSVGFLAHPIGALFFDYIGDKYGRGVARRRQVN